MQMKFYKYQGTGNDFIMIDNRSEFFPKAAVALIERLCDRRFGIGADGLILLENDSDTDFRMVYYNSDGNQSSMCGNGGRCLVAFAKSLGIIKDATTFIATDGLHHATILENGAVSLQMKDVLDVKIESEYVFLNTGSPHHVTMVNDLQNKDIKKDGAAIRYSDLYGKEGSNVNFVSQLGDANFRLRTYERGVEDETYSCGTGVTAAALSYAIMKNLERGEIYVSTRGGDLSVTFEHKKSGFVNIWLNGPAEFVFNGLY
jgi:diaminopimelate epimerase